MSLWQSQHKKYADSQSPKVQYTYEDGAAANEAKYVCIDKITYPSSPDIYYNYPSSGIGAALNRLDNIASSATPQDADKYAQYTYLGAGTIVKVAHPAVTGGLELNYGTDGTYAAFDRFGRVVDGDTLWNLWTNRRCKNISWKEAVINCRAPSGDPNKIKSGQKICVPR